MGEDQRDRPIKAPRRDRRVTSRRWEPKLGHGVPSESRKKLSQGIKRRQSCVMSPLRGPAACGVQSSHSVSPAAVLCFSTMRAEAEGVLVARTEGIGVTFDGISASYLNQARGGGGGERGTRGHRRLGRAGAVDVIVKEAAGCGCECREE